MSITALISIDANDSLLNHEVKYKNLLISTEISKLVIGSSILITDYNSYQLINEKLGTNIHDLSILLIEQNKLKKQEYENMGFCVIQSPKELEKDKNYVLFSTELKLYVEFDKQITDYSIYISVNSIDLMQVQLFDYSSLKNYQLDYARLITKETNDEDLIYKHFTKK